MKRDKFLAHRNNGLQRINHLAMPLLAKTFHYRPIPLFVAYFHIIFKVIRMRDKHFFSNVCIYKTSIKLTYDQRRCAKYNGVNVKSTNYDNKFINYLDNTFKKYIIKIQLSDKYSIKWWKKNHCCPQLHSLLVAVSYIICCRQLHSLFQAKPANFHQTTS